MSVIIVTKKPQDGATETKMGSWLKRGADSTKMAQQEQQEFEQRQSGNRVFRFSLEPKEEAPITFVDGDLNPSGFLEPVRFYEHNLQLNGKWFNFFICPEKTAPEGGQDNKCPICEGGDRPYLASAFTVIDHRVVHSKKDATKTYVNQRRLLIAKPQSFELLNKLAMKRGGLATARFDVSRMTKEDFSIGNVFDFIEKTDVKLLKDKYFQETVDPKTNVKTKTTIFIPFDYESEFKFKTGVELRKLGWGKPNTVGMTGFENQPSSSGNAPDYSKQL